LLKTSRTNNYPTTVAWQKFNQKINAKHTRSIVQNE
jgi:hypothetical protein